MSEKNKIIIYLCNKYINKKNHLIFYNSCCNAKVIKLNDQIPKLNDQIPLSNKTQQKEFVEVQQY